MRLFAHIVCVFDPVADVIEPLYQGRPVKELFSAKVSQR